MWDLLPFLRKAVPHNPDIVYIYPLWNGLILFLPKARRSLQLILQREEVERMNKLSDGELHFDAKRPSKWHCAIL